MALLPELAREPEMAAAEAVREVRRHDRPSLGRHRGLLPENKVSLGFVEGLNNKIRVVQRRAYGLRDEHYLRLKILTCMLPTCSRQTPEATRASSSTQAMRYRHSPDRARGAAAIAVAMWTTQARCPLAHSDNKKRQLFENGPRSSTRLHEEANKSFSTAWP
jgi:hypothetical protein